jgi:hypothetical protein
MKGRDGHDTTKYCDDTSEGARKPGIFGFIQQYIVSSNRHPQNCVFAVIASVFGDERVEGKLERHRKVCRASDKPRFYCNLFEGTRHQIVLLDFILRQAPCAPPNNVFERQNHGILSRSPLCGCPLASDGFHKLITDITGPNLDRVRHSPWRPRTSRIS